ncbi:hypothetical protein JCM15519_20230 [Fundidesulfovibrio butyratiphilus]
MLNPPDWPIRKTLNLLVLCSLLPAMGAMLFFGWLDVKNEEENLGRQMVYMADSLGEIKFRQAESCRLLLGSLAEVDIVRKVEPRAVTALFRRILENTPLKANLALALPDGRVCASAAPCAPEVSLGNLKVFADAVRTKAFSAGEFALSPVTGIDAFHYAMPVFDGVNLSGVLFVALPLQGTDDLSSQIASTDGARVALLDHVLRRIHRVPENPLLMRGMPAPPSVTKRLGDTGEERGRFVAVGGDGERVLYGFRRLRLAPGEPVYLTILVGAPVPSLMQALTGRLGQSLLLVGAVLVLALAVSRLLSEKSVGEGMDRLTAAADTLAAGDTAVRVGEMRACSELIRFGRTFDHMMDELASREHALRDGREQLAAILDSASDGVYGVDQDAKITFANPAALTMLGYADVTQVLGRDDHTLIHHTRRSGKAYPVWKCPIRWVLQNGRPTTRDDEVFWTAQGMYFSVEYTVSPIRDGETIRGAVVAFRDITERLRVQNELTRHREHLEVLVEERTAKLQKAGQALKMLTLAIEQSPVSVVITDRKGRIEYVNPRFCETTGYSMGECLGNRAGMVRSGEHGEDFYQDLWSTITSGKIWKGDFVNRKKTGELFWENASIAPIFDENGQITHFMAVKLDITLKKQAEEALRDKQKYLSTLLSSINTGILLVDRATHLVVDVNPSAELLLGAGKVELLGKDSRPFFPEAQPSPISGWDLRENGASREIILTNRRGEHVPALVATLPLEIGGRGCLLLTLLDITERKRMEEELRSLAFTDALTGVNNRRRFLELAHRELERAKRYGTPFSYLTLDVDHFKSINDAYGHEQGDQVLKSLASTCLKALRDTDIFGRLGGEEFGAVLIESTAQEALSAATRLLKAAAKDRQEIDGHTVGYTVSIGVCSWRNGDDALSEIMRRADKALYEAKARGRNRVVTC